MIFSENRYLPIGSWPKGMLFRIMLEFSLPWIKLSILNCARVGDDDEAGGG